MHADKLFILESQRLNRSYKRKNNIFGKWLLVISIICVGKLGQPYDVFL